MPNLKIEHNTTLRPALQCYDTPVLTGGVYCGPADQLDHKGTKNKDFFLSDALRLARQRCFGDGSQASLVWPSGNSNIKMKWSVEQRGMTIAVENRNPGRTPCPSASLSTKNPTITGLGSNKL